MSVNDGRSPSARRELTLRSAKLATGSVQPAGANGTAFRRSSYTFTLFRGRATWLRSATNVACRFKPSCRKPPAVYVLECFDGLKLQPRNIQLVQFSVAL